MVWNAFQSQSKVELTKTNCNSNSEAEAFEHSERNECAIFVNAKEIDDLKDNSAGNCSFCQQVGAMLILTCNLFQDIDQAACHREYGKVRSSAEASDKRAVNQRLQTHHWSGSG